MNNLFSSPLIKTLSGNRGKRKPIWFMRQAGRYLPEYRKLREKSGSFLSMCLNPELAAEISLQPLKRFDIDAVIVFSDILTIPMALGKSLEFVEQTGPIIEKIEKVEEISNLKIKNKEALEPIYKTLKILKKEMKREKTLVGFAGAPFTIASYMLQGNGKNNFSDCVSFFEKEERHFKILLDKLANFIADHLINQIKSGAEVVQIFDSHASLAQKNGKLNEYCIKPVQKIVKRIRSQKRKVYIIGFPRNIGSNYLKYIKDVDLDCISLDQHINPNWIVKNVKNKNICYQGNLDPMILAQGGIPMQKEVKKILLAFKDVNHIFNLGHGVLQQTKPENVSELIQIIRSHDK